MTDWLKTRNAWRAQIKRLEQTLRDTENPADKEAFAAALRSPGTQEGEPSDERAAFEAWFTAEKEKTFPADYDRSRFANWGESYRYDCERGWQARAAVSKANPGTLTSEAEWGVAVAPEFQEEVDRMSQEAIARWDAVRADAARYRAIKARYSYSLVNRFIDQRGYSSHKAGAQIDAWADAAAEEVAAWESKSPEETTAWFAEYSAAALAQAQKERQS